MERYARVLTRRLTTCILINPASLETGPAAAPRRERAATRSAERTHGGAGADEFGVRESEAVTERRIGPKASKGPNGKRKESASKDDGSRIRIDRDAIASRRPPPEVQANDGASSNHAGLPKTTLTTDELQVFRILLLQKRLQLVGDVGHMEDEALRKNRSDAAGDLSMMPIHMADIGTDAYEQEFTIGLIENEEQILKEIDAALGRIRGGSFGICEASQKPIAKARLKAKPWARYCVASERAQEENGQRR